MNKFTVVALKEILSARGLSSSGSKAELISRMMEADPSGAWMNIDQSSENIDTENSEQAGTSNAQLTTNLQQREIDLYKKEKELAERELALARLEIEVMQMRLQTEQVGGSGERQQHSMHSIASIEGERSRVNNDGDHGNNMTTSYGDSNVLTQPRTNITAIADLLNNFNGKSGDFEVWEKQIKLLKSTYKLEDETVKLLFGMRLKGRALEWLHSKPEYITMTFDQLLDELRAMFYRRQSKIVMRKKFEERVWKKEETFHEYFHEKLILGNRVPISDDEILEYVIDGIPDEVLRNQARIQRFSTADGLLEAFEKVTLRDRNTSVTANSAKSDKRGNEQSKGERKESSNSNENKKSGTVRCYNCGERDHVSTNCPTKDQGTKCFKCGERGYIALKCTKKSKTNKESCVISGISNRKCLKNVLLNGREIEALIDSGSDFSLIRADEYIKLGSPIKIQ